MSQGTAEGTGNKPNLWGKGAENCSSACSGINLPFLKLSQVELFPLWRGTTGLALARVCPPGLSQLEQLDERSWWAAAPVGWHFLVPEKGTPPAPLRKGWVVSKGLWNVGDSWDGDSETLLGGSHLPVFSLTTVPGPRLPSDCSRHSHPSLLCLIFPSFTPTFNS